MKQQNFDSAFEKVKTLVEKFKQGENHYLSSSFSEAAVRQDFLDDFFIALGWDVRHQLQHNPYEQEVKIEQGVKVSGAQKRADYSFAIAPNFRDAKFFAEAKKPARSLKNAQDYFQSIRYGWHKSHSLSILTDFEELHILDCRYTPDVNNSLDKCYKRFHYSDYLIKEKFEEIYFLFSREAVANNSIEKYSEALPKRKGKIAKFETHQTIDEAFLEVIDGIREKLAKAFKKQDENLTSEELTEATQRTVDRLVFIRFLEDKLIEQEHWVSEFGEKGSAWNDFISACRKLDVKYNGIFFKEHFIDRQNFAGADENEFRTICQDICHLNSRFLFNEIPIHILGSIYERFLGKVVHATAKRVTIEEKPEVQKAGGVYYTPKYIVDYIVHNTVGKLIEEKTPEQISKLRFADIACGSGSFLIGVFDCLLDYHNKYYQKNPDKAKKDGCIEKDAVWILSIKQKQKILLNNIYGVDIDQQATEVTQLSLALKMLEDETTATANEMNVLFHEKILPDMSKNIICGNSLIGTDILTKNLFAGDEERKLNPMNYEDVFKDIMHNGGFDAIVGNPPYVRIHLLDKKIVDYFFSHYKVSKGQVDLYSIFIERSIKLLKTNGKFGYIVPRFLKYNLDSELVRKLLLNNILENITEVGMAFKGANTECIVFTLTKGKRQKNKIFINTYYPNSELTLIKEIQQDFFEKLPSIIFNTIISEVEFELIDKILKNSAKLESIAKVKRGMEIGKANIRENKNGIKTLLGGEVKKYEYYWQDTYVNKNNEEVKRLQEFSEQDKILIRRVSDSLIATFDDEKYYFIKNLYALVSLELNLKYFLGLINSKLLSFFFKKYFTTKKEEVFPEVQAYQINALPIKEINFQNKTEKSAHDKIVSLVEQMLQAKKEIKSAKTAQDKTYSERKCSSLDTAIDTEVYKLYDLSEEEIKIVEGKNK